MSGLDFANVLDVDRGNLVRLQQASEVEVCGAIFVVKLLSEGENAGELCFDSGLF